MRKRATVQHEKQNVRRFDTLVLCKHIINPDTQGTEQWNGNENPFFKFSCSISFKRSLCWWEFVSHEIQFFRIYFLNCFQLDNFFVAGFYCDSKKILLSPKYQSIRTRLIVRVVKRVDYNNHLVILLLWSISQRLRSYWIPCRLQPVKPLILRAPNLNLSHCVCVHSSSATTDCSDKKSVQKKYVCFSFIYLILLDHVLIISPLQ